MKQIIGFEFEIKNDDDICPNCGHRTTRIPIGVEETHLFTYKSYIEYTCDKCHCKWKIV